MEVGKQRNYLLDYNIRIPEETPMKALVTGAGQRLGRAIALELGSRGYDVAVHYNTSREGAEETARLVRETGVDAQIIQADLLDESMTRDLVDRAAVALGGPLSLLVNNASIFEDDTLGSATRESWDRAFGSNLRAPFVLTQEFATQAPVAEIVEGEPRARAMVLNMIDQKVRNLSPDFMSYTLAKSALWTFTQLAAQELGPHIRVNAIGPGPALKGPHQSEADFAAERKSLILQRGTNPGEICAALAYFLSAPAVTGQMLCVDGGQHLG